VAGTKKNKVFQQEQDKTSARNSQSKCNFVPSVVTMRNEVKIETLGITLCLCEFLVVIPPVSVSLPFRLILFQ